MDMPRKPLTERQQRILDCIRRFIQERGYPPTMRDIGRDVGISSSSAVKYQLEQLERRGFIERDPHSSRGIRLSAAGARYMSSDDVVSISLLGVIAAGEPIPVPDASLQDVGDTIELTRGILGDTCDLYALRVQGDSMIDALIHDGDIVIMRFTQQVENGEMAAVWLRDQGETTLKRVYWEGGRVRLQPANPTLSPIYIDDPGQVEIQGKVVMVIRQVR